MTSVIVTEALTKRYGRSVVVDDVALEVREGDLFGFLGPNGSGKTTTIRMLLGLVFATSGSIEVMGRAMPADAQRVLPNVGALVEGPGLYAGMSARRNLALFDAAGRAGSARTRRQRIDGALERVGLAHVGRLPTSAFSLGMKQRLGLAAALMRAPKLLVLDEPTNGLDPQGINEMRALFRELVAEGTTVFLSSHLLTEVEQLCTTAAMMSGGRLVAHDSVAALAGPTGRLHIDTPDVAAAIEALHQILPGSAPMVDAERIVVDLAGRASEEINRELVHAGVRVRGLVVERRTLEDAYFALTRGAGQ